MIETPGQVGDRAEVVDDPAGVVASDFAQVPSGVVAGWFAADLPAPLTAASGGDQLEATEQPVLAAGTGSSCVVVDEAERRDVDGSKLPGTVGIPPAMDAALAPHVRARGDLNPTDRAGDERRERRVEEVGDEPGLDLRLRPDRFITAPADRELRCHRQAASTVAGRPGEASYIRREVPVPMSGKRGMLTLRFAPQEPPPRQARGCPAER